MAVASIPTARRIAQADGFSSVIASGGAGKPEHFVRVLTEGCADAALAASIFHYGTYTVNQLKEELDGRGIPVRLA
jgi:cyclase